MLERLEEPISGGEREILDVGKEVHGWGVPCGVIEWERARGDREDVKHRKHHGVWL